MIETYSDFCEKYGDDAGFEVLERICDGLCPLAQGVHFSDIISRDQTNHTLSGTITHDDKVFGFLIDSGNSGGTAVRYFYEEDQTVEEFYQFADEREARRIKRLRDAEEEKILNEAIAKWQAHKQKQAEIKRKVEEEVMRLRRVQEENQRRRAAIRARAQSIGWIKDTQEKVNWPKEGF